MQKTSKKIIPIKVEPIIIEEFDEIKEEEGIGNRAATFTFLVKEYRQRKQMEFEKAADQLGEVLDRINKKKIPSPEEQLGLN